MERAERMKKSILSLIAVFMVSTLLGVYLISRNFLAGSAQEKMAVSFTSFVTSVRGLQRIQLAEVNAIEVFERTSEYSLFWDAVKLPDVVVQARVPVRYSYYIDMKDSFSFEQVAGALIVHAPRLRAGPPAPDVSSISYQVTQGSLFRNSTAAIEELRRSLTPLLARSSEQNRLLVHDEARRQLEALIRSWLLQNKALKDQEIKIQIQFEDEPSQISRPQ